MAATRPGARRSLFYVGTALVSALVVFTGFAPTYYLARTFDAPALTPFVHVHGAVFTAWILVFGAQAGLVAAHRTDLHRRLGIAGTLLAAAVVVIGFATAVAAAKRGHTPLPAVSPLAFLVMPIGDLAVFALLATTGLALRRRPDVHGRLMLLATVGMLGPAIARFRIDWVQDNNPFAFMIGVSVVVIACAAVDTYRHGRLHPAFLWGGLLVVLAQPLRLLLARTDAWMAFATWLTA